jgi:hypothetical protein
VSPSDTCAVAEYTQSHLPPRLELVIALCPATPHVAMYNPGDRTRNCNTQRCPWLGTSHVTCCAVDDSSSGVATFLTGTPTLHGFIAPRPTVNRFASLKNMHSVPKVSPNLYQGTHRAGNWNHGFEYRSVHECTIYRMITNDVSDS